MKLTVPCRCSFDPPEYGDSTSPGIDIPALIAGGLSPGHMTIIPTGLQVRIPDGHVGIIVPRHNWSLRNPGVEIQTDYLGPGVQLEVQIVVRNGSKTAFKWNKGDKLAQLVLVCSPRIEWYKTPNLENRRNPL